MYHGKLTAIEVRSLYNERVADGIKMLAYGASFADVREVHGFCVAKDAEFRWSEYWKRFTYTVEGHAKLDSSRHYRVH